MKFTLRLILSLGLIVGAVALVFAYHQARQEEDRLNAELKVRVNVIAESLRMLIEPPLTAGNTDFLKHVVDKFSGRGKLEWLDIRDLNDHPVIASPRLPQGLTIAPDLLSKNIQEVRDTSAGYGRFVHRGRRLLYVYSLPLKANSKISDIMSFFYDADFIQVRVHKLWMESFLRSLVQVFLITIVTFFIILLNVMIPLRKITEWIREIRKGEPATKLDAANEPLFKPLTTEISRMARNLEMARFAAAEEARLRYSSEARWTPERLKEVVRRKLEGSPLFVVSNREPYMHIRTAKDKIECIIPASGLVTALEPVLNACGGTWIAQGSGDADRETVDKNDRIRMPPEEPKYTLRRVWITKELNDGFYSGLSNEGLWPLCHIAHTRPQFRPKDWEDYKAVNEAFAQTVLQETEGIPNPYILIQDYHFALLPRMVKAKKPHAKVAIFWHIPWPNPESFGICPWYKDILKGMLASDLVGFHTQFHCNNFIESVDRFLESRIDYEHFTVNREGHTTWVKPFPISIGSNPAGPPSSLGHSPEGNRNKDALLKPYNIQARWMGVGVDRLDYTKGILERFRAIENLMESEEELRGKFTFVELGAPSRTMIPQYKDFVDELVREAARINDRFKVKGWQPILLLMKHHSHREIEPFYKAADVCLVTSLHDGMNLVAKEFVWARDDEQGVLILSQFTGAARELKDALIVNPYDIAQTSKAVKEAVFMSQDEQAERMSRMRRTIRDNNIYRWAGELVSQMTQVRPGEGQKV
ncbi:MAG: trehalose-6-phosphate synthase [Candidatus Omnitrophica bacterium]|nr:trehalose-6-phosphate synthase [Candidatus Omnitrophota bacterium]MDE2221609.1 trehalose-6-phosphate synthase [Candidatus Omnitrophota bacterium]